MSIVSEILIDNLPFRRKATPSGWISFNAVCCHHTGASPDTRNRGGVLDRDDIISYHCFNCGFKASWQPGWNLSIKMRNLLSWLGVPDDQINKLTLNVMRINEGIEIKEKLLQVPTFTETSLPPDAVCLNTYTGEMNKYLEKVLYYMQSRKIYFEDGDFYWSPHVTYRERLIIPFTYRDKIVGWTARHIGDKKPKYLAESQPGFVFNMDQQDIDKNFVIVSEGPIDAMSIQGVALMGSEINQQQALLINRLRKDVILIPDRDAAGKKLIEPAIEFGWSVSMPDWEPGIKDVGDAVNRYGRLYTLYTIVNAAQQSPLKIRLRGKKWFV